MAPVCAPRPPPKRWLWNHEGHLLERYERRVVQAFDITLLCTDAEAQFMQQKSGSSKSSR